MSAPFARSGERRLRVMQITDNLGTGGLEQVVVTLCRTLDRSRFDPSVLCLSFVGALADKLTSHAVPVLQLPRRHRGPNYLAFREIARILREQRIDVVHTHNTGPFIDGGIATLLAGVPTLVHTEHGRRFPDKRRYVVAEHLLSRLAYKVVGVSQKTVQDLRRFEHIAPAKLAVITNGIELEAYSCQADRNRKRRELGLPADGPVIGVTARLDTPKGITHLLQAVPRLRERYPDVSVVIAGTGPLHEALQEEARALGVADCVRFLGLRTDVPELLQIFDVYVLPSISEGLPMALIEAMCAGCAIVATDVGGVGTLIRSGATGMLVPPASPAALSDAIEQLLRDESLRGRVAEGARTLAHRNYGASTMARRYEQLYTREAVVEPGSDWRA